MASGEGDHLSLLSSEDSAEGKDQVVKEQRPETPKAPVPTYTDEELAKLETFIQKMTILYCLNQKDWREETLDVIRRWLMETNELMLTIFYDKNKLVACLGFPLVSVFDLSYFMRKPNQIFTVDEFHDEVHFGTLHGDVDGCMLKVLQNVYAPIFHNYTEWNDNVKLRFCNAMDKFLCYLTGLHYKMAGMTYLYVPHVIKKLESGTAHTDREFLKNLEEVVKYWNGQIRTCLNDNQLTVPHDLVVPVEEYEFWLYRYEVVQGLHRQLMHEDIQSILTLLKKTQSVHIKSIEVLITECQAKMEEARSNIKYLKLFVEPCNSLDKCEHPKEIPPLIPKIVHVFRYIWLNSQYYNTVELIGNLFKNLSNQVIRFCLEQANINRIFSGNPRFGIKMCDMAIDCCMTYKVLYEMMSEEHAKKNPQVGWPLDKARIFNHVDAFVERLNDLTDICKGMIVFARMDEVENIAMPQFCGTRANEFQKTVEEIEKNFAEAFDKLVQGSKEIILNVHKNQWYQDVLEYRQVIQSLEEIVQRLISDVFQYTCNTEEDLESLAFLNYFTCRENLRKAYIHQVTEMWKRFSLNMKNTTGNVMDRQKHRPSWLPKYAQSALWYKSQIEHYQWIYNRLSNAEWLPVVPNKQTTVDEFFVFKADLEAKIAKTFEDFIGSVPDNVLTRLDRTLLVRSKVQPGLLECNIDRTILPICYDARLFAQMGFEIPKSVGKLYEKYDNLQFVYNSVLAVCLDYNRILGALAPGERKLFRALLTACDRKIVPGVFKLSWGGEMSDAYIADCAKHTGKIQETLDIYKSGNLEIAKLCEKMCDTPILKINLSGTVELKVFADSVYKFMKKGLKTHVENFKQIKELLAAIFVGFEPSIEEMRPEWKEYVRRFDNMMELALLTSVRNSLRNIYLPIHGDGTMGPTPIILMFVNIEKKQLEFTPSFEDVTNVFIKFYNDIIEEIKPFPRLVAKESISSKIVEDTDCQELKEQIANEVKFEINALISYLDVWLVYKDLWIFDIKEHLDEFESEKPDSVAYEKLIDTYGNLADKVAVQETITSVHFVIVNSQNLRNALLDIIDEWQVAVVDLLLNRAVKSVNSIYRYMEVNITAVSKVPRTIAEMKNSTRLYQRLVDEVEGKQNDFPGMYDLFRVLDKYKIPVPDDARSKILGLEQAWSGYLRKLLDVDEMLGNAKEEYKQNLILQAEKFKHIIKSFLDGFLVNMPTSSTIAPRKALRYLESIRDKLVEMFNIEAKVIADLAVFHVNQGNNLDLRKLDDELKILEEIWEFVHEWDSSWKQWRAGNFWQINVDEIEDVVLHIFKNLTRLFRIHRDRNWEVLETTKNVVDSFRKTLPLITALKNSAMRPRHWDRVRDVMKVDFDENAASFNLAQIIELDFQAFSEEIQDISNAATQELAIENGIKNIAEIWKTQGFEIVFYRDGIYRIKSVDDCLQLLEEHQVQISTMKSTRFVEPFIKEVDFWEKTLSYIAESVEKALVVQRQWLYLEIIFSGEDIRKQLPEESFKFEALTQEWGMLSTKMFKGKTAQKATHFKPQPFLLNKLQRMDEKLEVIQRALEIYLETKRQLFPRFYFVSNDDLLEILGNARRPDLCQNQLKKLFDNLNKLELAKVQHKGKVVFQAAGMYSDDGEFVEFINPMFIDGPAERWLAIVEDRMINCLKEILKLTKSSLKKMMNNREKWLSLWPGQLCQTTSQIQWTADCTRSLIHCKLIDEKKPLRKLKKKQNKVLMKLSESSRKELPKILRLKVNTLITLEIHGRDVIERMYKNNCKDVSHFEWFSQLRFYWDRMRDVCVIRQTNTEHTYMYEYTGNSGRLAITPLTDRCYITLTTALHLHRGGSPKGPAGTGKTETVKDLGKALGIWVIVTNCSEGLDFKSIGKNFSGLAQQGAWGCFDEFNRINIEVLSVVAQQILSIMSALTAKLKRFMFEGMMITLKPTIGLFITMNPGYAGRTELPDNLKSMFRPISMMVPDNALIAENTLFSDGFQKARNLARKVFTLYELAKQQLSKQYHYDFGLRSMVALLRYAGRKRRQFPHINEEEIVYLAMRDMNVARLTANDLPLFIGIMSDIFPGVSLPVIDYSEFKTCIDNYLKETGMQLVPIAPKKVIELYETKNSRHSSMIIGNAGTAKTVTWKTLQGAFCKMKSMAMPGWENVVVYPINPKSLNLAELYGEYNLGTGEWMDGVLSQIMRTVCADEDPTNKWILFDGPVDAVWIENMNSVMDDNKLLTLVNAERITMPPQVSLLFEVLDLAVASPATVSRCGMVYNDYNDWGWRPYVNSWLQKQKPKEYVDYLRGHFEGLLDKVLEFKRQKCKEIVKTNELNVVMSLCNLLECLATKENGIDSKNMENMEDMTRLWFMFCLVWSVCATVDEEGRLKMDAFVREKESCFPIKDTIYDYYVEPSNISFSPWEGKLNDDWRFDPESPFYKIIVPTIDTVRYEYIVTSLLGGEYPVLLVGNVGTGKTSTAVSVTESKDKSKYSVLNINISAQTSSQGLQESIEIKTEKRTKTTFVPIGGKKMIIFMDDFNMPAKDVYGSQPPLELIRQWIDYKFWYNRKTQQRTYIQNTLLMGGMGPPGGGRTVISPRTQSRFAVINLTFPAEVTITRIFGTMLKQRLGEFLPELIGLWKPITAASIDLYNAVIGKMLPTPDKMHYLFNLRDISKVFQGMLRIHQDYQTTKPSLIRVWIHEVFRVFADRLTNDADMEWFINALNTVLGRYMEVTFHSICKDKNVPIFGDFLNDKGYYEDFTDLNALRNYMGEMLAECNNTAGNARMDLVFFKEAIEHVTRIARVISQPRGHMLNIGIGGSGRQVLARVAAHINEMGVFSIEVSKKYKTQDFKEDLKGLYKTTGVKSRPMVFLFSGEQVAEETFMEILNNMLATGEANLFKPEEFDELKSDLERAAKRNNIPLTTEALYSFFMKNVRDSLHIVLCLSPIGEKFRIYMRQYPALINATTTDWFRLWPQEALLEVAHKFLDDCVLDKKVPGHVRGSIEEREELVDKKEDILHLAVANVFAIIHSSVESISELMLMEVKRHNYVTPINYLKLVTGYKDFLDAKRNEISAAANKLRNGLSKIAETQEKVFSMSEELKVSQEQVNELAAQCEIFLLEIDAQSKEVEEAAEAVAVRSEIIAKEEVECMALAEVARADLELVMPMIDEAVRALDALSKKDISEVKSYAKPPLLVEKVMEGVMILIGKEPNWETSKKVLGEQSFLNDLKNFDRDHISDKTLKRIATYTGDARLEPVKVGVVSFACKSLMLWIKAIENYGKVYRIVAPKQARLNEALASLAEKQAMLAEAKRKLQELNDKLDKLRADFLEKSTMLEELKARAEKLRLQLERAVILVESLGGEQQRWIDTVARLDRDYLKLPGDCLIATAFVSYFGPFDTKYREALYEKWQTEILKKQIPCTEGLKMTMFLADPVTIREWNIQGLPNDEFSIENGVVVRLSSRWPLIIDPQCQAHFWIRNLEKKDLKIVDFGQSDYIRTFERCLQFGTPVLLQNVTESIDPALNPILRKTFTIQSGVKYIRFNDKFVPYKDSFKLYITTKLSNPHYPPEISAKTTLVNFAVKQSGLEAQLLGIIVRKEKPALEEQKDNLVMTIARNKRTLMDLDNEILRLLNESKGDILEDEELFNTLQVSRATSIIVKESLSTAEVTEVEIDTARQAYEPAAERASILFFVLMDMAKIDPMYQFSLAAYVLLFTQSIERSPKNPIVQDRILNINEYHTYSVYKNTCRGLFEKHKLLFSIHMCAKILQNSAKLVVDEYDFILKGGIVLDRQGQQPNPAPHWISEAAWDSITELDKIAGFHGITDSFEQHPKLWNEWYATTNPETEDLIGEWNDKLNGFQKFCVVRCLRLDRMSYCMTIFVVENMGPRFVEPPVLDLKSAFEESLPQTPLIFVLSPGVDPTASLINLAEQIKMSSRLNSLSLGQGQAPVATQMLTDGVRDGNWVYLANCHLSLSWMPALDKMIETLQTMKIHKRFRLWLSSSPHPDFPISILQTGIKMTTEPPRGIKANMKRLYNKITEENFEKCEEPEKYKRLLYTLCFFHTLLLERKKFQQLGWNVDYSFNDSDFEVSEVLLALFLNEYEETPWGALKYLIASVNYGGHVTDDWDRRLLMTYINSFYVDDAINVQKFKLSSLSTYYIPLDGNVQNYLDHISLLPNFDKPEAFGQHPNADIASSIGEAMNLFGTLVSMQDGVSSSVGESKEDNVDRLANDIQSKVPDLIDYEKTAKVIGLNKTPMEVVLLQEIERYNFLLNNMNIGLRDLRKGIKGLVVMSTELENIFISIYEGRVPGSWLKSYASLKPLAAWARDLIFRIDHFASWAKTLNPPALFWLAAYTFPTGFLTAVLQTTARSQQIPIDELSWDFYVFVEDDQAVSRILKESGVYVRNMFLEGGAWNRKFQSLQDPAPMELISPMPVIHFKPVENLKKRTRGIYACPAYYLPMRSGSYVIAVDLKSGSENADYWVKRGTALLLSLAS